MTPENLDGLPLEVICELSERTKEKEIIRLRKRIAELESANHDVIMHRQSILSERVRMTSEMNERVGILKKRLDHTEVELSQARVSRDSWKIKFEEVLRLLLPHLKHKECCTLYTQDADGAHCNCGALAFEIGTIREILLKRELNRQTLNERAAAFPTTPTAAL